MNTSNEEMYAGLLFSKTLINNISDLSKEINKLREHDPEEVILTFGYYISFLSGMIQMMISERSEFKEYFNDVANILRKH